MGKVRNIGSITDQHGVAGVVHGRAAHREAPFVVTAWVILALMVIAAAAMRVDTAAQTMLGILGGVGLMSLRAGKLTGTSRVALYALCMFMSARYMIWRSVETISFEGPLSFTASILLFIAEIYSFAVMVLGIFVNITPVKRRYPGLPLDPDRLPKVDVLIPSYNEDPDLLKITLMAGLSLRYPADKLAVYLLDDGGTVEKRGDPDPERRRDAEERHGQLQALCAQLGARYLTRERNVSAKAGNINAALEHVSGDLILVLDADHVPTRDFLERTVGWFTENEKVFLVQTPHFMINPDPIERNLDSFASMPSEPDMFYSVIQPGLDTWNSSLFCGSAALLRRKCLDEVGGIAGQSITEDAETGLELHARGYDSVYVPTPMSAGLAPDTFSSFISQRMRWAQGMVQIFLLNNPLLKRGLTLPQRLCYFNSCLFWFFPVTNVIYLMAPLAYGIFGLSIYTTTLDQFVIYAVPHILATAMISDVLYGHVRWPIVSSIYETLLSFYCLRAIGKVFANPRSPTFVVTPKIERLESDFLSPVAVPLYFVLGALFIGEFASLYRSVMFESDRWLAAIVLGWNTVNLFTVAAVAALLFERRQRRAYPRMPRDLPVSIQFGGAVVDCRLLDLSVGGARLRFNAGDAPLLVTSAKGLLRPAAGVSRIVQPIPFTLRAIYRGTQTVDGGIEFNFDDAAALRSVVNLCHGHSLEWQRFRDGRSSSERWLKRFASVSLGSMGSVFAQLRPAGRAR